MVSRESSDIFHEALFSSAFHTHTECSPLLWLTLRMMAWPHPLEALQLKLSNQAHSPHWFLFVLFLMMPRKLIVTWSPRLGQQQQQQMCLQCCRVYFHCSVCGTNIAQIPPPPPITQRCYLSSHLLLCVETWDVVLPIVCEIFLPLFLLWTCRKAKQSGLQHQRC